MYYSNSSWLVIWLQLLETLIRWHISCLWRSLKIRNWQISPIIIWVVRKAKLIALIEGSEWKTGRIYENFWYCGIYLFSSSPSDSPELFSSEEFSFMLSCSISSVADFVEDFEVFFSLVFFAAAPMSFFSVMYLFTKYW